MPRGDSSSLTTSISAKLLNMARASHVDFAVLLRRYAFERLLYRLGKSPDRDAFVLKGAFLFYVWGSEPYRTTQDLDLLGLGSPSIEQVRNVFHRLASSALDPPDGLLFTPDSTTLEAIRESNRYEGIRVRLTAGLGKARIPLRIDIGFGDVVTPPPRLIDFSSLLGMGSPSVVAYPPEAFIAEKVQAMVELERPNSRMKDFYDVWVLSRTTTFSAELLAKSLGDTFVRREWPIPATVPDCLSPEFFLDPAKQTQWSAFIRRALVAHQPPAFVELGAQLRSFLWPLFRSLAAPSASSLGTWSPGGPWPALE